MDRTVFVVTNVVSLYFRFRESQERCLTSSSSASSPASHLLCAYPSALSHVHPLSALSHVHLLAHLWCAQFQYASRNAHPAHRATSATYTTAHGNARSSNH